MKDLKRIYTQVLLYQNGDIDINDFNKNIDEIQIKSKTLHNIRIKFLNNQELANSIFPKNDISAPKVFI